MASTNDIILQQYNSSGNWDEKVASPSFELEVLGLDSSLNPIFKTLSISDISGLASQLNGKASTDSVQKLFNFTTGTSLAISGATYNFHTLSVAANSSFSLSNLTTGLLYEFLVKNTGGASITITLPNTADVRVADTVDIASGKAREFSLLYDGTKRYWQVSEELTGA